MHPNDIGYLIKNINDKLKMKADADLKSQNLTLSQSRVLAFLHNSGGRATQKEIEDFLEVSHPTVVGIVSRMQQNGFVTAWMDPDNRRNKIVELTPSACETAEQMTDTVRKNEAALLRGLSSEQVVQLKEMLMVIYQNIN